MAGLKPVKVQAGLGSGAFLNILIIIYLSHIKNILKYLQPFLNNASHYPSGIYTNNTNLPPYTSRQKYFTECNYFDGPSVFHPNKPAKSQNDIFSLFQLLAK
ncbi:hypothetical protein [Pontibacter liquoris]|uniref:hypothetical protein n=1 Tax=Pontibacter liquoris TaxID=2905677 RepID=UPI001FA77322|nr:hypothetical protein [Pontibacter liquoris]